ncbi:unnamed protein product [Merluccius merluccius]
MNGLLLMSLLLWSAGKSSGVGRQELTCRYVVPHHRTLPRVWCKMRDSLCCSGVEMQSAAAAAVRVEVRDPALREDADSFTVSAASLPGGGGSGVYWCGVLANGTVLVKLAESYFYSSMLVYVWSIARWVVLPSVLALTFLVSWYSTRKYTEEA